MFKKLFNPPYRVKSQRHVDQIVKRMILDGNISTHYWDYVKSLGARQHYDWRTLENYLEFDDEESYFIFLLKL